MSPLKTCHKQFSKESALYIRIRSNNGRTKCTTHYFRFGSLNCDVFIDRIIFGLISGLEERCR